MTTQYDVRFDEQEAINKAVESRDSEALFKIARQFADKDDMEFAFALRKVALQIDKEDWAHDEAKDNDLCDA